jgi:malonyl-CoA O-methyltransferase
VRPADAHALARCVARLQARGDPPWLHAEIARRMGERLAVVRREPALVVDWWARAGGGTAALRDTYPRARLISVEPPRRDAPAEARPSLARRLGRTLGLGTAAPPPVSGEEAAPAGEAGLVWANMMLHLLGDPMPALRRWHAALAVDGFLMFSTLGPGTLPELRELYRQRGWGSPMAPLTDMHDLGDMLVAAGFADPVMDQETLTLTWGDAAQALAELRTLGANADPARFGGLRTPRWRARLLAALAEQARADGHGEESQRPRIALRFEVVYGHAFKPPPRASVREGTAVIGTDELRAALRSRGKPGG